jgi:hypothetical protein
MGRHAICLKKCTCEASQQPYTNREIPADELTGHSADRKDK